MTHAPVLSGLVLAGGRSRRMGTDKAVLTYRGERLADRAVRVLDEVCAEVLLAPGDRALGMPGRREVADALPGAGPVGGLLAGLEAATHPLVAVLAVDHLHARAAVFRELARAWAGEDAVVPEVDGRVQPLHGVWARTSATTLRAQLAGADRSLRHVFGHLDVRVVGAEIWGRGDPTGRFATNANRPEDLEDEPGGAAGSPPRSRGSR